MQNKLTRQEQKVFDMLLTGAIPKEIASTLNISYNTVLNHQRSIYSKLGVHSINELLANHTPRKETDNLDSDSLQTNNKTAETVRRRLPFKIVFPIAAAVILALVIPLTVWAVRKPPVTEPLVITFNENHPWPWKFEIFPDMFYYENEWQTSPFQLGAGNKINQGDTFLVNLHFVSDTDLDELFVLLHDFIVPLAYNDKLQDISYHCYFGEVKANTKYEIGKRLIATRNASSAAPEANIFTIYAEAETQPTILFTKLEIVKIN